MRQVSATPTLARKKEARKVRARCRHAPILFVNSLPCSSRLFRYGRSSIPARSKGSNAGTHRKGLAEMFPREQRFFGVLERFCFLATSRSTHIFAFDLLSLRVLNDHTFPSFCVLFPSTLVQSLNNPLRLLHLRCAIVIGYPPVLRVARTSLSERRTKRLGGRADPLKAYGVVKRLSIGDVFLRTRCVPNAGGSSGSE